MNLPSAQFSRLVTTLAFDITDPSLDLMIRSWDHVTARFLKRLDVRAKMAGQLESLRLLAIHDAVHAVLGTDGGFSYRNPRKALTLQHALSATAQASHDLLKAVFREPQELDLLADTLRETLDLLPVGVHAGADVGRESAEHYLTEFATVIDDIRDFIHKRGDARSWNNESGGVDWTIYKQSFFSARGRRRIA